MLLKSGKPVALHMPAAMLLLGLLGCAPSSVPWLYAGVTTSATQIQGGGDEEHFGVFGAKFQHLGNTEFTALGTSLTIGSMNTWVLEGHLSIDLGHLMAAMSYLSQNSPWWLVLEPEVGVWFADTDRRSGLYLAIGVGVGRRIDRTGERAQALTVSWVGRTFYDFRNNSDAETDAVQLAWTWRFQ